MAHAHKMIRVRDRHILVVADTIRRQIDLSAYDITEYLRQRGLSAEELSDEDVRSIEQCHASEVMDHVLLGSIRPHTVERLTEPTVWRTKGPE